MDYKKLYEKQQQKLRRTIKQRNRYRARFEKVQEENKGLPYDAGMKYKKLYEQQQEELKFLREYEIYKEKYDELSVAYEEEIEDYSCALGDAETNEQILKEENEKLKQEMRELKEENEKLKELTKELTEMLEPSKSIFASSDEEEEEHE
jgi:hypothetical protein